MKQLQTPKCLLFCVLSVLTVLLRNANCQQRPFYNIAHMVNSIKEINYYLARGANAIETDVSFAPNGTALYTFHGYPCDCFRHCTEREEITKYLEYVREITRTGKSVACCLLLSLASPVIAHVRVRAHLLDKLVSTIYIISFITHLHREPVLQAWSGAAFSGPENIGHYPKRKGSSRPGHGGQDN